VSQQWSWPSAEGGFVLLLAPEGNHWHTEELSAPLSERRSEAPVLAACGYAVQADRAVGLPADEWLDGVSRLSEREAIVAHRNTFIYRPHEVFGIALGLAHYEDPSSALREWLAELIERVKPAYVHDPTWKRNLLAASAAALGGAAELVPPEERDVVGAAYWLVLRDWDDGQSWKAGAEMTSVGEGAQQTGEQRVVLGLLKSVLQEDLASIGAAQAAAVKATVRRAVEGVLEPLVEEYYDPDTQARRRAEKVRLEALEAGMRNVERRAKRWGRRYESVLRFLLLPFALLAASVLLIGVYRWLDELRVFEEYGSGVAVAVVAGLLLLGGYFLIRDWEKSPANVLPQRFGEWNAERIRRRWLGRRMR
jgi:hypothetical protein